MKNDNFHTFFSLSWLQMLNLPALLQNKNTRIGPFPWKRSVLQNPDRERTNQSTGISLGLGLPYNKGNYFRKTLSKVGKCVVAVLDTNSIDFISQFNQLLIELGNKIPQNEIN